MSGVQFNTRLAPDLNVKLEEICRRWGCSKAAFVRIVINHLHRREDIVSPLDIERSVGGAVDALVRIKGVCERAIKQSQKERRETTAMEAE